MKYIIFYLLTYIALSPCLGSERKVRFNDDWKFSMTDTVGAIKPEFNDSGWKNLNLPHDWSVEYRFDRNAPSGNDGAYLPTGTGWYRKDFNVDSSSLSKKMQLYLEGAYMKSDVYVNGKYAGGHPYGYSSYFIDITPYIREGNNAVAIRVDNSMQKNCRWYSGSGIYRNVWLIETDKIHIDNHGVKITTPDLNTAVISTTVVNENDTEESFDMTTEISGINKTSSLSLKPGEKKEITQYFNVPEAKAWSPDSPEIYTADISIKKDGIIIDNVSQRFGFRTLGWSSGKGFELNGKSMILNGSCVHHDNGILGAAAYDNAERRRVKLLKDAGFNAVRTSHNIPSEAFLDACDEIGLLVIDEAFDGWRDKKNDHDYSELFDKYWQKDLDAMILRDRNHPSIFCWSIGNEVIERDKIEVVTTARKLAAHCHAIDPTRPVTSALACWGKEWKTYDPLAEQHDIVEYNYMIHESEKDHERNPGRIMMQTESYPNDAWDNYRKVKDNPYIIGDFVWTGMDYLGESGIGRWHYEGDVPGEHYERPLFPWHAAYCGDIDLTGFRKPISHYRSMLWNEDGEHLYIAVKEPDGYKGIIKTTQWGTWPTFHSWNWPGHEGKDIEVEVYSHYPEVRLYLDDKLIGETKIKEMKAVFTLPYEAGTLKAEGICDGKVMETSILKTSGKPFALRLSTDKSNLNSDKDNLSFITIEVIDKEGNVVPMANNIINVTVSGNADLKALGNADIKDNDPYFDTSHKVWNGRALAIVSGKGTKGKAIVKVSSPGLKAQSLSLTFKQLQY